MKKVFKLKKEYHDFLAHDVEFVRNINRQYYVIKNILYKGQKINVGIPLRSNINKNILTSEDEYIETPPTNHTLTKKGNAAGWHITKIIPITFDKVIATKVHENSFLNSAFVIANDLHQDLLVERTIKMLQRFEKGEKVFGAINFDKIIEMIK